MCCPQHFLKQGLPGPTRAHHQPPASHDHMLGRNSAALGFKPADESTLAVGNCHNQATSHYKHMSCTCISEWFNKWSNVCMVYIYIYLHIHIRGIYRVHERELPATSEIYWTLIHPHSRNDILEYSKVKYMCVCVCVRGSSFGPTCVVFLLTGWLNSLSCWSPNKTDCNGPLRIHVLR